MRQSREAIKGLCFCLILLTVLFLPGCIQLPAQPQAATPSPTVSPSPVSSPVPTASPAAEVAVPSPTPQAISEEAGEQVRQELSGAISGPLNYFKARFGTVEANWDKYSDERKREKLLEFCGDAVNISVLNLRVKYEYYDKGMVSLEDVVKTQDSYETVTDLCRRYSFNASLSDALPGAGVEYFEQAQAALQPENRAEIMFQVLKSVVAENEKEMTAAYAAETASLALSLTRRKTAAAAVATAYFSQAPATPPLYRVVAGKGCGFLDFTVSESSSRGRIFQYGVEVAVRGLPQGNFTCDASLVAEAVMQEKKTIPVRVSYFDADALLCSPEEKLNVFYCTYDPDNCEKGVREGFSGWDGCVKKMDELNGRYIVRDFTKIYSRDGEKADFPLAYSCRENLSGFETLGYLYKPNILGIIKKNGIYAFSGSRAECEKKAEEYSTDYYLCRPTVKSRGYTCSKKPSECESGTYEMFSSGYDAVFSDKEKCEATKSGIEKNEPETYLCSDERGYYCVEKELKNKISCTEYVLHYATSDFGCGDYAKSLNNRTYLAYFSVAGGYYGCVSRESSAFPGILGLGTMTKLVGAYDSAAGCDAEKKRLESGKSYLCDFVEGEWFSCQPADKGCGGHNPIGVFSGAEECGKAAAEKGGKSYYLCHENGKYGCVKKAECKGDLTRAYLTSKDCLDEIAHAKFTALGKAWAVKSKEGIYYCSTDQGEREVQGVYSSRTMCAEDVDRLNGFPYYAISSISRPFRCTSRDYDPAVRDSILKQGIAAFVRFETGEYGLKKFGSLGKCLDYSRQENGDVAYLCNYVPGREFFCTRDPAECTNTEDPFVNIFSKEDFSKVEGKPAANMMACEMKAAFLKGRSWALCAKGSGYACRPRNCLEGEELVLKADSLSACFSSIADIEGGKGTSSMRLFFVPVNFRGAGYDAEYFSEKQFEALRGKNPFDVTVEFSMIKRGYSYDRSMYSVFYSSADLIEAVLRYAILEKRLSSFNPSTDKIVAVTDEKMCGILGCGLEGTGIGGYTVPGYGFFVVSYYSDEYVTGHEIGHTLGFCDEYSYEDWSRENKFARCLNAYPKCCSDAPPGSVRNNCFPVEVPTETRLEGCAGAPCTPTGAKYCQSIMGPGFIQEKMISIFGNSLERKFPELEK